MATSPRRQIPQLNDQEGARIRVEINAHGEHITPNRLGIDRLTIPRTLALLPLKRRFILLIPKMLPTLKPTLTTPQDI